MKDVSVTDNPDLKNLMEALTRSVGGRLRSVVLYGSAARGDYHGPTSDLNLLLVLEHLDPATLEGLTPALGRWRLRGHPFPHLFSPALIRESADVFPIEFLDIQSHRVVLHGEDPFVGIAVGREHLRLQCERELKEKLMRLREAYVEVHAKPRVLRNLLTDSYSTFASLFRGCLHLLGSEVPGRTSAVVAAFCEWAGLERGPFESVHRLKLGEETEGELKALFARYYQELGKAVRAVDRFKTQREGEAR
jgi:predicted nucleotidyltransferase